MRDEWGRRPEIIEGEYEVIDEWDTEDTYYTREDRFVHINHDPPYITYGILAVNIGLWLIMSFIGTVFGLDLYYQLLYFGAKINQLIVQGVLAPFHRYVSAYWNYASFLIHMPFISMDHW